MKTNKLALLLLSVVFALVSCETENPKTQIIVDFENVSLTDSVWNGSDGAGDLVISGITFTNKYDSVSYDGYMMYFWNGFACSAKTDKATKGFENQYAAIAGSGAAGSKQYALVYDSASISLPAEAGVEYSIESAMLTNNTWAYYEIKEGGFGKVFAAGDWFKVIVTGYLDNKEQGTVEYYLADFRDGKSFISDNWAKVDFSALGNVDKVSFLFDSTDKFGEWMNTPAFVCIDNVVVVKKDKE